MAMLARALGALLFVAFTPACKRVAKPVAADGGAVVVANVTRPDGPTIVQCAPTGCPGDGAAPPRDGGELVVHVEAEPAILCDLVEHDAWSRWIAENEIMETLLYQDPWSGKITPRLAATFELTADALTLHLRAGVKWHDGKPLTAADVAYTIGRARDPAVGADQRSDFEPVSTVETPDAATIVLKLTRPAPFLKQALAHLSILPEHLYQGKDVRRADASRAPVGTGPFKFVSWHRGEELIMERNADYWGEKAHLARVRFKFVRDREVAWELYHRGDLDLLWQVPSSHFEDARNDPKLSGHRLLAWTPRAYFFVVWNTERGRLADRRVRRALTMLLDRPRFNQVAFSGHARDITGPYVPGTPSYDATLPPLPVDAAAAKKLLDEAGVKTMKLTFLASAGSRTVEQLATLMKEDFAKAGITVEIATVDFAVQLDRLRHHAFDASALQWTMLLEQDNFTLFHSSQAAGGQNYGSWKSPEADALLDQIRATGDDDARHALDRKLHRLVYDEQPYSFISMREVETLMQRRVHALVPSQDGFSFARAWVDPDAAAK
ncbi:MAG: Oligopeptide transporter, periplasmic oligopeptide-binding protein OppA [Myxococcales bacterium]|nr:Oligopeptide transporter, periplasmic oligopeptide-binding protein OppA [Myxococcales bacterium]